MGTLGGIRMFIQPAIHMSIAHIISNTSTAASAYTDSKTSINNDTNISNNIENYRKH